MDAVKRWRRAMAGAFTLIEMLVVVAVIMLLLAILLPAVEKGVEGARAAKCGTQQRQLQQAFVLFADEHDERVPGTAQTPVQSGGHFSWDGSAGGFANIPKGGVVWPYYKQDKILLCPSDKFGNGKLSYSTPEFLGKAGPGGRTRVMLYNQAGAGGAPATVSFGGDGNTDPVACGPVRYSFCRQPEKAIWIVDEDEQLHIAASPQGGFGRDDEFGDRHGGKASVVMFDGHAECFVFPKNSDPNDPGHRQDPRDWDARAGIEQHERVPYQALDLAVAPWGSEKYLLSRNPPLSEEDKCRLSRWTSDPRRNLKYPWRPWVKNPAPCR